MSFNLISLLLVPATVISAWCPGNMEQPSLAMLVYALVNSCFLPPVASEHICKNLIHFSVPIQSAVNQR